MFAAGMKALELTDAQQAKMKTMRLAHAKEMVQLRADQKIAQLELRDLMGQDAPKAGDIDARVDAVNAARGKIMKKNIHFQTAFKNILTPEQREKLKAMRQKRGARRGKAMRGRRGGRWNRGGTMEGRRGGRRAMGPWGHRGGPPAPKAPAETPAQ